MIEYVGRIPWDPRIPPRFWPARPASRAAIDAMVELLELRRADREPSPEQWERWVQTLRTAAYADRVRQTGYSEGAASIADIDRLSVALVGALRHAAVLVELRDARLRNRPAGINHNDRP